MIFKGQRGTIRVVSPVTEDGNRPKIDPETKKQIFREDYFPGTAKAAFEDQNKKLPPHLQKIIEPLSDGDVAVKEPEKKKPGPKPKPDATTN